MKRVLSCLLCVVVAACSRDSGDQAPSPLLTAPDPAGEKVDLAAAARDGEVLRRVLNRPHHIAAEALGAHRFTGKSSMKVSENGTEVESLELSETLDRAADGSFEAQLANSRDYGRDVFFHKGTLWLRPGFGKYHRRPPADDDEPARLLDETFASLAADYDLVAEGVAASDGGQVSVAGRPARKIVLALADRPRARQRKDDSEDLPQRAWRKDVAVVAVAGELALDEATGALLSGKLDAKLRFVKQGRTYEMTLHAEHTVTDIGGAISITPPAEADSAATPGRSGESEERDALLKGLAPPARRGPAAAPATPAAPAKPAADKATP